MGSPGLLTRVIAAGLPLIVIALVFGGAGYVADYGIERFYRDVRIFRLYEGTSQIQQIVIARNLLRGD